MTIKNLFFLFLLAACWGCHNIDSGTGGNTDSRTRGTVHITVDEEFKPLFDSMETAFEGQYPDAHLIISYKPEAEAVKDLYSDSVRLVIIPRKLNAEELQHFKQNGYTPDEMKIASDGLAFIVNRANPDTTIYTAQIEDILAGNLKTWDKVTRNDFSGDISLVADNTSSSAVRYISETINAGKPLPANMYAQQNNEAVIQYVTTHPHALGIIGVNWVSDTHDPKMQGFLKSVKVVALSAPDSLRDKVPEGYFWLKPQQSWIALKLYPYLRDLYVLNIEGTGGLGTGFADYIASEPGQIIIEHSGLMPAKLPTRIINNAK